MFIDRKDAAQQLAVALAHYQGKEVVVLGIPRGGAETAYYIAQYLHAPLSLLIARKLAHPADPEYAIGALAEDGSRYLNPNVLHPPGPAVLEKIIHEQQQEIQRRIRQLRGGQPLPDLKDKVVILADDGIATGSTLFAAIELCKKQHPQKLIVAAPVAGGEIHLRLKSLVDEVVILDTPPGFYAVSQGYASFPQLTDEEARLFFQKAAKGVKQKTPE